MHDALTIGGKAFSSRLMLGTGKYRDFAIMQDALAASGAEIITVSIRRVELGAPGHTGLMDVLGKDLLPAPIGTLRAAEILVGEGFTVLPYMHADPVLARQLAALGCATVMPLASPIGSGRGVLTRASLEIIIEESTVPVVVDAGLGVPSEAASVMELGAQAVLVNTAIAEAESPVQMAAAFRKAVEAGREAYLAGRMPIRAHASPSSPTAGVVSIPQPEVPA